MSKSLLEGRISEAHITTQTAAKAAMALFALLPLVGCDGPVSSQPKEPIPTATLSPAEMKSKFVEFMQQTIIKDGGTIAPTESILFQDPANLENKDQSKVPTTIFVDYFVNDKEGKPTPKVLVVQQEANGVFAMPTVCEAKPVYSDKGKTMMSATEIVFVQSDGTAFFTVRLDYTKSIPVNTSTDELMNFVSKETETDAKGRKSTTSYGATPTQGAQQQVSGKSPGMALIRYATPTPESATKLSAPTVVLIPTAQSGRKETATATAVPPNPTEVPTAVVTVTQAPTEAPTATVAPTAVPKIVIGGIEVLPSNKLLIEGQLRDFKVNNGIPETQSVGLTKENLTATDGSTFELISTEDGFPLTIQMVGKQPEKATLKNLARVAGLYIGNSTTISYAQSWSPESKVIIPVLSEHGNQLLLDYDLMWYNPDYPENSLRPNETTFNTSQTKLAVDFARKNSLHLQGQTLLVSMPRFLPPWLTQIHDPTKTLAVAENHITTMVSSFPQIDTWCVAAELENQYSPNYWTQTLKLNNNPDGTLNVNWLKQVYDAAHAANPKAKLYYSDFDIEFGGKKADRVFSIMQTLKSSGAPINAIAFQMHLEGKDLLNKVARDAKIAQLKAQIARYQAIGIEVIVPEMDINMVGVSPDQKTRFDRQAEIEEDVVDALLESGISSINHFGGIDKLNWKEDPSLGGGPDADAIIFNDKGTPKPSYYVVARAIVDNIKRNQ